MTESAVENISANVVPPKDSNDFITNLRSPDFNGKEPFKNFLVNKLKNKISNRLMATDHPVIGFSEEPYRQGVGLEFSQNDINRNGRYILRDPHAFFQMLAENPQDFSIDCLNIVPILIVDTMRDALIERGHDAEIIDKKLTGMIFHGGVSELTLDNQLVKPFSLADESHSDEDVRSYVAFSQRKKGVKAKADYTDDGALIPDTIVLNTDVEAGDIVYSTNQARRTYDDFGNGDSQTAIILNTVPENTVGDPVQVFAHRTNSVDRDMTFGGVIKLLETEALKTGMSLPEYIIKGGSTFDIVSFDYVGFYSTLAASLSQTQS